MKSDDDNKIADLKKKLQSQMEDRKLPKYPPGKRLTNDEIIALFASFHESKPIEDSADQDYFSHLFSQPLLTVFGFERREFIEGCKQIAKVIGDAVSSPQFRAHIQGATHSCRESELLQSVTTPKAYEIIKYLSFPTDLNTAVANNFLTKLFVYLTGIPITPYKLIAREFLFRRIEKISLEVLLGDKTVSSGIGTAQVVSPTSESSLDSAPPYRLEMTACIRYQVQSSYCLDVDDDLDLSESLTHREESEWYFLYLRSYLTDYENQEWKITNISNENEFLLSRLLK